MAGRSRPKTLARAVNDLIQVYAVSLLITIVALLLLPTWLRWLLFYAVGIGFLINVMAIHVENWIPRSRVQATGKAVFITGCDSGFGHSLAQRLDDLGLQVFAGCLFPDGKGASSLKKSASSRLHILHVDVTSDESLEKAVKCVTEKLKDNKLWAVVNNAGISDGGELFWTSNDLIKKVMEVNHFGVVRTTKAFLPLLVQYKGRVVTVASSAGRLTAAGMVPYCMSKQATISFCDGLRQEMYRFGIKVTTIEPWTFRTAINTDRSITQYATNAWETAPAEIKELFPKDYLQRYIRSGSKLMNYSCSDKPQQVVDCMEEAVMALTPKYSYSPGTFYSKVTGWMMVRLPRAIADLILNDEFGISME